MSSIQDPIIQDQGSTFLPVESTLVISCLLFILQTLVKGEEGQSKYDVNGIQHEHKGNCRAGAQEGAEGGPNVCLDPAGAVAQHGGN